MSERPSGGAAVVRALERNGVRAVFGIPGSHDLEIDRHLAGSSIAHIAPRHEQGAGYAADGYARASGEPGVCITTTGPGLTNACTAAATAYADSVPVLVVSPGVPVGLERADVGWLHEMKDQQAHLETLVARSVRVPTADEAVQAIDEAFARWRVERPRPVHVEIPLDVLEGSWAPAEEFAPEERVASPPTPCPEALGQAAELLSGARRPAILLGGGARRAPGEARRLAEVLGAAVVTTVNGKGVVAETLQLSLGASIRFRSIQRLLEHADLLIVIGSELGDSDLWGGCIEPAGAVVRIDIDAGQLQKNLKATTAVQGDSREVLSALLAACQGRRSGGHAEWLARVEATRYEAEREAMEDGSRYREIQEALAAALPDDVLVAGDSAQVSYYGTVHFWPMDRPRRFLYPTGYATLGYGLPAAIGAKVADQSRAVIALVGDGGFLFTAQEIATAAELRLSLPIVVVDNGGYAEIREEMKSRGVRPLGVDREPIDLPALSRALGGRGVQAEAVTELPALVDESLGYAAPTVIALRI